MVVGRFFAGGGRRRRGRARRGRRRPGASPPSPRLPSGGTSGDCRNSPPRWWPARWRGSRRTGTTTAPASRPASHCGSSGCWPDRPGSASCSEFRAEPWAGPPSPSPRWPVSGGRGGAGVPARKPGAPAVGARRGDGKTSPRAQGGWESGARVPRPDGRSARGGGEPGARADAAARRAGTLRPQPVPPQSVATGQRQQARRAGPPAEAGSGGLRAQPPLAVRGRRPVDERRRQDPTCVPPDRSSRVRARAAIRGAVFALPRMLRHRRRLSAKSG